MDRRRVTLPPQRPMVLGSVWGFVHSPCVWVGFRRVDQFPPTVQKHAGKWTSYAKFPIDVNKCVNARAYMLFCDELTSRLGWILLPRAQSYWERLRLHCHPDHHEAVPEDEWTFKVRSYRATPTIFQMLFETENQPGERQWVI